MTGPTRRDLLASATFVAAADPLDLARAAGATSPLDGVVKFTVRRPEDLLSLTFEFRNARIKSGWFGAPKVTPLDARRPVTAIVGFPSQHVDEQAWLETELREPPGSPPAWSSAAGGSRLCFDLTAAELPLITEALLDWSGWQPRLSPDTEAPQDIRAPADTTTAIEFPKRVIISGGADTLWLHGREPGTRNGRTEIWHTRLTRRDGQQPAIRATWSPDYVADAQTIPPPWEPVITPLNAQDRNGFVHITHAKGFDPEPIPVDMLGLSAAGGWLHFKKIWTESCNRAGYPFSWTQKTSLGRDSFTEVEYEAFLYPFGFKVTVAKTTERKVQAWPGMGNDGFLRQHFTIRFKEPYPTYDDYRLPFVKLEPVRTETPYLDFPTSFSLPGSPPDWRQGAFWPSVLGAPYVFEFIATDAAGRKTHLTAPLICVPTGNGTACATPGGTQPADPRLPYVQTEYLAHTDRSTRPYFGQTVAFTHEITPMQASHPVQQFAFDGELVPVTSTTKIDSPFRPLLASTQIASAAATALGGADASNVAWFTPADPKLSKTRVYLLSDPTRPGSIDISFVGHSDRSGGVGAPRIRVGGFGADNGPFGTAAAGGAVRAPDFLSDHFNPLDYLHADTTIVGVKLSTVLKEALSGAADAAPKILSILEQNEDSLPSLTQSFDWTTEALDDAPPIGSILAPIFLTQQGGTGNVPDGDRLTRFTMTATAGIDLLSDNPATAQASGRLSNFAIQLAVLIDKEPNGVLLKIREAWFTASTAEKSQFGVELESAQLVGKLFEFIQKLEDELGPAIGQARQLVDISPEGVTVTLPPFDLPDITLGYMDLTGLTIASSVCLPFTKQPPSFTFDFSTPEDPFTVCVGIFAGGGYLSITLDSDGIQNFTACFQFGGFKALEFGIVSGRVFLFGGVFYSSQRLPAPTPGSDVTFDAFVHAGGEVSVFSIVTVSVDFYVALVQHQSPGVSILYGEVTLTYSVKIGFFSRSARVHYTHTIQGSETGHKGTSGGDYALTAPRQVNVLSDHLTRAEWREHCEAFA